MKFSLLEFDDQSSAESLTLWHKFWLGPILEVGSLLFHAHQKIPSRKLLKRVCICPTAMSKFLQQIDNEYGPNESLNVLLLNYWQSSSENSVMLTQNSS